MRSRYTAYSQERFDYIESTMCGPALDLFDKRTAIEMAKHIQWDGLSVHTSSIEAEMGVVSFTARYRHQGVEQQLCETSYFKKIKGQWFYDHGIISESS